MATKKMKTPKKTAKSYALPGESMTTRQFENMLSEAEREPYINGDDVKKNWEQRLGKSLSGSAPRF